MKLVTWSLTDNLLEIVTSSILTVDARLMSGVKVLCFVA